MIVTGASYIAELVGTFFFVLSIMASGGHPLAIGGALALVIYLIASVSGGHVNPAVSAAMWFNGSLTPVELVFYVLSQIVGALGAVVAYKNAVRA